MPVELSRQALASLQGMSQPQPTGHTPQWTKIPTPIIPPTNPKPRVFDSLNPYGKRKTQTQVLTKPGKRVNTKPSDEPQSKRRRVGHSSTRSESPIIVDGPARNGDQSDDSMNPRATSEDELNVIPSNTYTDRYPRTSEIVQGALSDDPIIIDNEPIGRDFPVKGTVQQLKHIFEGDPDPSKNWRNLSASAKHRMKGKGGAPFFQTKPLPNISELLFESSSWSESSTTNPDMGHGRITWNSSFEAVTLSGHQLKRSLVNCCSSVKFFKKPSPSGSAFVEIAFKPKESNRNDAYAFWFKLPEKREDDQFNQFMKWLSGFKKPDKINSAPDVARWNVESKTGVQGSSHSSKIAALNALRSGKVEQPPSKSGLSRKPQRYTPDQDLPATTSGQVSDPTASSSTRISSASVRRSARNSTLAEPPKDFPENPKPVLEPDKVILSYPQGAPGAVNITNADLARLRPGEFLNDTLIEFGLKLWLKDIEDKNPEFANQVHIFNSFFYKKLNQHKKGQQGYDNVKKWTSKFDIFQKKFIIVPINENMHWYLAIIYEPEHVLREAPITTPTTRRQAKGTPAADQGKPGEDREEKEKDVSFEPDQGISETIDTSSEGEVERDLNQFQASCSINDDENKPRDVDTMSEGNHSDLSYVSDPQNVAQQDAMEVHQSDCPSDITLTADDSIPQAKRVPVDDLPESTAGGVSVESFYGRRQHQIKKKTKAATIEIDVKDDEEIEFVEVAPRTHIFVFDSLGIRHTAVGKNLSNYLKMEALDKKGVVNASNCESKIAAVPIQPNFCDCGLYLLHFAKVFMTDPAGYFKHIVTPKPKMTHTEFNKLKKARWLDEEVPAMRGYLKQRIIELSINWLKDRPTSRTPPIPVLDATKVDDSDSDVDIVETGTEPKGKQRGTRAGQR